MHALISDPTIDPELSRNRVCVYFRDCVNTGANLEIVKKPAVPATQNELEQEAAVAVVHGHHLDKVKRRAFRGPHSPGRQIRTRNCPDC